MRGDGGAGGGLRRAASRASFVAAAACVLLLVVTAVVAQEEEDDAPRPEVFRGAASALAVSVGADRDALLPIPDIFRFIALEGSSAFESSNQSARSSILFPGNGAILGPNLLCGTFGGAFPPEFKPVLDLCLQYRYPLTVFADELTPDGQTTGSLQIGAPTDPISANAVRATAHAAPDGARTDAVIQDLRLLGLPAIGPVLPVVPGLTVDTSILDVDSATARTNQRIVDGGLVVDASTTLSGVHLVGGLVRIGSIRSQSHVTDDAAGKRTATTDLEITGVTVAGIPSQITEDGLVVGSPSGGLGPILQQLQTQVNELLRALGLTISLLPAEEDPDAEGGAVASSAGLLLELSQTVNGLPTVPGPLGEIDPNGTFVGSVQLGQTAARGAAFAFDPDAPPPTDDGGVTDLGSGVTTGGDVAFPDLPTETPTAPTPESPGPVDSDGRRSIADIFEDRLGLVYLALALAALGLAIAPRFALPARLPGARS